MCILLHLDGMFCVHLLNPSNLMFHLGLVFFLGPGVKLAMRETYREDTALLLLITLYSL